MRRVRVGSHRVIALITSYLVLSLFLVYSNAMTLGTLTQRLAADRLRDRYQALDLAQGAMEQLREDLHRFLTEYVYAQGAGGRFNPNDAIRALEWLDDLGIAIGGGVDEVPLFDPDGNGIRDGSARNEDEPQRITLSTG